MALVNLNETWVGVQRRATDQLGKRDDWFPASYVTLKLEGDGQKNLSADSAKRLAKALVAAANLIDPPKPRVRS